MSRRSSRVYDVTTALDGIRQTARGRRGAKFTTLMHHIYQVERLREAYLACKRDAAAGVDGQTWASYGQDLEARLLDLSDRLARGGYRPQPVKRAYIDKADGSKRPLGVPALEDKIVQRASAEVLNAIYEQDFKGFSYGFRPGRSAHNALDAVAVGVGIKKVSFILDADISKFFDTIEHDWLVRFIEHRVADARVVRPGFQFRDDAVRFQRAVTERLGQFGLTLNETKTRLIEFGRFAREDRRRRGQGKPQTFDFLGFTHCCGKTRKGKFMVLRLTSAKRMRAKLQALKLELRKRLHRPVAEQGEYLRAVVTGHARYFGVPNNGARLLAFRFQVARLWHRTLCRRSQTAHVSWKRMYRLIDHWLPRPHICHPYPNQRLIVTTQGKSRVR
jgi:retron-type reverse transcriptase